MRDHRWRSQRVLDDHDDIDDLAEENVDDLLDQFDSVDDSVDLDDVNIDGITDDDETAD